MIFYRKEYETAINAAVFPALQGGRTTADRRARGRAARSNEAILQALCRPRQVECARASGGASSPRLSGRHRWDGQPSRLVGPSRPLNLTGSKMELLCEAVHITLNKNAVHGDTSAATPGGVRIGTPAMTTRGLVDSDFLKLSRSICTPPSGSR